ncbi:MAG: Asp-tRNA(Asn)/Glu-tRNA(Gln) amidotransferase subunit GatC [Cyclobacteriaceae bacterium]|jgi:aspartyl-tRNA(Asn)/glutamyl-tRNA(Gln) amidotransferase subunit C|nr:Asp-tRNA(Asn)/Glu-tRNA(Gln) amidotransferase subunit GatC [Cyclobacteriaceae bacterium]
MEITKDTLANLANLARLHVPHEQEEKLCNDLSQILSWVEQLQQVDTNGVKPLLSMSHEINRMREDIAQREITREEALQQAGKNDGTFFLVPKVIDTK